MGALSVAEARLFPYTASNCPGAKTCPPEAAFPTPITETVDEAPTTSTTGTRIACGSQPAD